MADIEYFEEDAPRYDDPAPARLGTLINWAGAMMSVGLVAGMAVWAWQLTARDVSGVPVIQALEGPMRVAPEDPGGAQAEHQGLAVNRIAEGREAAPAADRIVLAPPPVDLAQIDLSSASIPEAREPEQALPSPEAASEATLALIDRLMQQEGAAPVPDGADEPTAAARAAPPADPAHAPGEVAAAEPAPTPETGPAGPEIQVIDISIPGVRRSPRPAQRPQAIQVASLTDTSSDAAPVAVAAASDAGEIDPDTLAAGTRLVQLGAFDDPETARAEWARLTRSFPDFFAGRERIVQAAVSGGRQFYRLRAHGFSDLSDARRFCTTLLAQGAACIPVTVR